MERAARLLIAVGYCLCLASHSFTLCLLWGRREIANGLLSALLLFFGLAAAKAFYVMHYSQKRAAFATVPTLKVKPIALFAMGLVTLAIATYSAALSLNGILPNGDVISPSGMFTSLAALLYLLLLVAAFSKVKK